jgi:TPR repeat protein
MCGKGVKQDNVTAYVWLALGEKNGNRKSKELLKQVKSKMNAAEVAKAKELVEKWRPLPKP